MIRRFFGAIGALLFAGILYPSAAFADLPVDAPAAAPADVAQAGPLSDVPLNSWAYDAVNQLAKDGIIKGYPDGTFKGQRPMTRYEAAVLAYRAVDFIEAQITAGKAVDAKLQSDIDAANKLIKAFGDQLKAVQTHVDALQKEADATQAQVKGQARAIGALQDFDKRAYIKFNAFYRQFAYGGSFQGNCSPNGVVSAVNGATNTYCNHTFAGNALLPGAKTAGYGTTVNNDPGQDTFANGQIDRGIGMWYDKLSFTGTPTKDTAFLLELSNTTRPASSSGTSTTTAYCEPQQNFLNGNANQTTVSGTTCASTGTVNQAPYADGETGFLSGMNNVWIQQSIANSGAYLRIGHVQVNEGPMGSGWIGGDYFWGGQLGITKGPFNGYLGYGVGNSALTNQTLDNEPNQVQKFIAEADYTFNIGSGQLNVGGVYQLYTGDNYTLWDPSAIMCLGNTAATSGATRYFANTAAVPFTSCGAGFTQLTYTNGAAVTGAYLSPANNNPTANAAAAGSYITPGLVTNVPTSGLYGHIVYNNGNWHAALAGSVHLGNDPYTGSGWTAPYTGYYQVDYGPYKAGPGNHGRFTFESLGFAVGFNAPMSNDNYFGGPTLWNSITTNLSSQYFLDANVKYWTTDTTWFTLGYGHFGLLPNTLLPASGPTCGGCVVSGLNQNFGYMEYQLSI